MPEEKSVVPQVDAADTIEPPPPAVEQAAVALNATEVVPLLEHRIVCLEGQLATETREREQAERSLAGVTAVLDEYGIDTDDKLDTEADAVRAAIVTALQRGVEKGRQHNPFQNDWREAIEWALGVEMDPINHDLQWARQLVREICELGNARAAPRPPIALSTDELLLRIDAWNQAQELPTLTQIHGMPWAPNVSAALVCAAVERARHALLQRALAGVGVANA